MSMMMHNPSITVTSPPSSFTPLAFKSSSSNLVKKKMDALNCTSDIYTQTCMKTHLSYNNAFRQQLHTPIKLPQSEKND